MTSYIVPEYEEIEQKLQPFLDSHDLDPITVRSLIRGSIEFLEEEMPKASISMIDENNLATGVSVKPRNIKVNFKFAINSIFAFKTTCDSKGIWLILTILKATLFLLNEMTINFDVNDAIVIFCLYRLQKATPNRIAEYANNLTENEHLTDIQTTDIQNTLENLEKIGTVKLDNGNYVLSETILLRQAI